MAAAALPPCKYHDLNSMLVSQLILAHILGDSLMVFKDYTYMHQLCSNIRSYVGVNYVTLDQLPGKEQGWCFILHCMASRRGFGCWTPTYLLCKGRGPKA